MNDGLQTRINHVYTQRDDLLYTSDEIFNNEKNSSHENTNITFKKIK